jgi:putative oxidoreductase
MEIGLLLLRVVVGLLMAAHGAQKLFGWFGGHGPAGTAGFLEALGWRPGRPFAMLLGAAELLGGLALALGLGTPIAAGVLAGVLANAAWTVHRDKGLWNTDGGYEFPLTLVAAALATAFTGAGAYSLDGVLGWSLSGTTWGLVAVGLGLLGWLVGVGARALPAHHGTGVPHGVQPV